tara:strand:+ start:5348 stop:5575 length:228 start_codon:yes stop_codon:yes gene_type:complete
MCVGPFAPKVPSFPATPLPEPPEPPPARDDPEVNAVANDVRKRRLAAKGRQSTILSGGLGDTAEASVGTKTLLGG